MNSLSFAARVVAVSSLFALAACGGDPAPKTITIDFAAVAGTTPISCASSLTELGTTNATGALADLRFYIANVKLVKSDGSQVPLTLSTTDDFNGTKGADAVTLIDLENRTGSCIGTTAMNASITGTVPADDYTGIKMTLGVPMSLNHTDQSADVSVTPKVVNNAVHPGMSWTWAGGRKFAKIEVTNAAWPVSTFNVHLGSTGCTGTNPSAGLVDTCARPNRVELNFASFNPTTQKVAVDVKTLLAANDMTADEMIGNGMGMDMDMHGSAGCMSGNTDSCQAIFNALGLDLTQGIALNTSPAQAVFKVVAK